MKKILVPASLLFASSLCFIACKKDSATTKASYTSLNQAFAEAAPQSKIVSLNATIGGSFYGNSGTRYMFYPNSFQDASGHLVTGNVDLEVLECTNEADMIFAKMLTMSNGEPLLSAGEVKVKATQSGAPVYIRPGYNYEVSLPTNTGTATAGMLFFTGIASAAYSGSIVNWLPASKDSLATLVYDGDTIRMTPDSIGFSNCDKFSGVGKATVDVKLDGISASLSSTDMLAYTILEGYTSAVSISSTMMTNTYKGVALLAMKSHIVVCGVYGGDFYGGTLTSITPTDGSTYTVTLSKTTPTAFKALINTLK